MFELIKDPKIDFMRMGRFWVSFSAVAMGLSVVVLLVRGLNLGIEFTGGAEIQVKFAQDAEIGAVRSALETAGIKNHLVTTISDPARAGESDTYIRVGIESGPAQDDLARRVVTALHAAWGAAPAGRVDLNTADTATLRGVLEGNADLTREAASALAEAIGARRREAAIFRSMDDLAGLPGMTGATLEYLASRTHLGPFAVRSQSYVGPAIGRELVQKAFWAILGSLGGILVYVAFRFELQWGTAAVLALVHDTVVTLGLFSLFGYEMSLPVVAAFLTLIGFSVNDTVVIFDRIREVIAARGTGDLSAVINQSVNQTLSRTVITSGLTWFVCLALFFFGGEALRPFSFVLVVGIVAGSYSTIYVASALVLMTRSWFHRKEAAARETAPAPAERKAKKVRTTPPNR